MQGFLLIRPIFFCQNCGPYIRNSRSLHECLGIWLSITWHDWAWEKVTWGRGPKCEKDELWGRASSGRPRNLLLCLHSLPNSPKWLQRNSWTFYSDDNFFFYCSSCALLHFLRNPIHVWSLEENLQMVTWGKNSKRFLGIRHSAHTWSSNFSLFGTWLYMTLSQALSIHGMLKNQVQSFIILRGLPTKKQKKVANLILGKLWFFSSLYMM